MKLLINLIIISCFLSTTSYAREKSENFFLQLELGPVWQSRNDVQIPNDFNGTRFSLVDLVGTGPFASIRLYFTWKIAERHNIRILLAPLSYTEEGIFKNPVNFVGETYTPGDPLNATYKFNSWRLTYQYKFHKGEQWQWWIGFTAKIRDAKIRLEQNGLSSEKNDLGFVPLLHIRGEYHINPQWWLLLDIDALAGGPGRAEDVTLQVGYNLSESWSLSAGYRTVEGGADVEEVYNFAWIHYLVLSINYKF
jgi:hypothetical protein